MELREKLNKKYYIDWKPKHSVWRLKIEQITDDNLINMYQEYIEWHKELREINLEFNTRYIRGAAGWDRRNCSGE